MSNIPAYTTIRTPMPISGTANAPLFDGNNVSDFLEVLLEHGVNAGIGAADRDQLVPYILRYSSPSIKQIIRYMPEFDADIQGKTWDEAKTALTSLFGSADTPARVTEEDLKEYCKVHNSKYPFANKQDVDTYNQGFQRIAAPLVKKNLLTTQQRDYYFTAGIPEAMKEWFVQQLPDAKRSRTAPPTIPESVVLLYKRFDSDSLLFNPWNQDDRKEKHVRFQEPEAPVAPALNTQFTTSKSLHPQGFSHPSNTGNSLSQNQMEELSRKMAEMVINLTQGNQTISQQRDMTRPLRCFICGKSGELLDHPLHPSRCGETPKLLREGLIIHNQTKNRYTLPSGDDLPIVPAYPGGVAAYLRTVAEAPSRPAIARDPPPHMNQTSSIPVAHTNSIGLSYGQEDVLRGDVFAVTSIPHSSYQSNPALRSGRDVSIRHDPMGRDENPKARQRSQTQPPPSKTENSNPQTQPKPTPKPSTTIPTVPTNPINTQDGWKASLPSMNKSKQDVQMGDETKKTTTGPQYHFTSDIQERTNPTDIFEEIMQTKIAVPISQVIGVSPLLQKMFSDTTRTRRAYTSKSAEYDSLYKSSPDSDQYGPPEELCASNLERLPEFLVYYSNAIALSPSRKFYAMTTGSLTVQLGGVDLSALVDGGSELNLAGNHVPDRTGCAVDFEGMKWSLRGIHGSPEQLQGVITDAPLKIAGYDFPHHFFVSHQSIGRHDLILGQPFLQWFAARIDYDRSCIVRMYLWKEGDRTNKPTLAISITDPADPRNATNIGHSHAARIEEVEEDEAGFSA